MPDRDMLTTDHDLLSKCMRLQISADMFRNPKQLDPCIVGQHISYKSFEVPLNKKNINSEKS